MNQHREMTKLRDGNPSTMQHFHNKSGSQNDKIIRTYEMYFGRILEEVQW